MIRFFTILLLLLLSTVNLSAKQTLTADQGVTVMGVVRCQGEPVEGVVVSDGALFTTTDSLGVYKLRSFKHYGSVFIVTPSGYEPTAKKGVHPQFWAPLKSDKIQKVEQHDFELRRVDNTRHRVLFIADLHLSSRNDDILQYKRIVLPKIKEVVAQTRDTIPTYTIALGDLCRNDSWYSQDVDPTDALTILSTMRYPTMVYPVMGENEYDGAVPAGVMTDHLASELYATACAPRFYSLNIGDVHYVVLDNTVFRNEAGDGKYPTEVVGKRNFDRRVSADCLAWLRRDLEFVKDKNTPIVVCMHHSVIRSSNKGAIVKALTKPEDTDSLTACFADFKRVHFVTAHVHRRRISAPKSLKNIKEHTVTSLSGNNWESAFNGYPHLCSDGSPAGFEIFDVDTTHIKWRFVPVQGEEERTFRAYDMNSVAQYYRTNDDVKNMVRAADGKRINYGAEGFENYVYINYWGDEPGSKLEVWEGNKSLKPRRVYQDDPLYTIATAVIRQRNARGRKLNWGRNNSQHMFRVQTDSLNSVVKIKTTDPFGRIFVDSLVRPVPFAPQAKRGNF